MNSDYLENEGQDSGVMGMVGGLYGWSAGNMAAQFEKTGVAYVPWTMHKAAYDAGAKWSGIVKAGNKFKGVTKLGKYAIFGSRFAGMYMTGLNFTSPEMFALTYAFNPAMLALGATGFAAGLSIHGAARGIEKGQYIDMAIPFAESQGAVTSRQRAVRAISESHLQARAAIGNEAQLFHR